MTLTVADIHRWDQRAVREVVAASTQRADSAVGASARLAALPVFTGWGGVAADTARAAIDRTRRDLENHAEAARAVARAAARAADRIVSIKAELRLLAREAPGTAIGDTAPLAERLDELLSAATALDVELASAIECAASHAALSPASPGGGRRPRRGTLRSGGIQAGTARAGRGRERSCLNRAPSARDPS